MHLQNVRIVDRLFIIDLVVENAPLSNVATSFVCHSSIARLLRKVYNEHDDGI